jgi:hypothetical protein
VSKGWRDLISSSVFTAAHSSRHGPLLVHAGAFFAEEPDGGRDIRIMDMDGTHQGRRGLWDDLHLEPRRLVCVNGTSCGGVNVVDPATAEVLASCPQVDVVEHDAFPYAAERYYAVFRFGRAPRPGNTRWCVSSTTAPVRFLH